MGSGPRLPTAPGAWDFSPALSSLSARSYLWNLLGGGFGQVGWLQRKHSIGAHILAQASQILLGLPWPRSAPAFLLCFPLKGCSGTGGLKLGRGQTAEGQAWTGSIHADKGWLPSRYDSALIAMPVARRGMKFSGNQTVPMTISPTLSWSLPKPPGQSPHTRTIFPAPRRDSVQTQGRALGIKGEEGLDEVAARRWVWGGQRAVSGLSVGQ